MRRLITLLLVFAPLMAQAQERDSLDRQVALYVQVPMRNGHGPDQPRVFPQGYAYLSKQCGVWGLGYIEKHYASSVAGFFCEIVHGFEIEQAIGGELMSNTTNSKNDSAYVRFGGGVVLGSLDKLGVEIYGETGAGPEPWWQVNALWVLNETTAIGIFGQKQDGIGPRIRVAFPDSPLRLWVMGAVNKKHRGDILFGGEFVFSWKHAP